MSSDVELAIHLVCCLVYDIVHNVPEAFLYYHLYKFESRQDSREPPLRIELRTDAYKATVFAI